MTVRKEYREVFPGIKFNVLLKNHTTFKIGGPAKYFFTAKNKEDLISIIKWAVSQKVPFFILGGGSNVLISDKGYKGVVIKIQNPTPSALEQKLKVQNSNFLNVEAGIKLADIVDLSAKKGLTGLEWAAGIPGTIGGAVRGNISAFGSSMEDAIKKVEVLIVRPRNKKEKLEIKWLNKKECEFSQKSSIFKKNKNLIILSCILKLKKGDKKKIKEKINYCLRYRRKNHPKEPSAGCAFKNCQVIIKNQKLLREFSELEEFNKKGIIPSSYLIDRAGLKGRRIGDAQISPKHANFIVNLGEAKSDDVLKLIKLVKKKVKDKFGIALKEELQILHS